MKAGMKSGILFSLAILLTLQMQGQSPFDLKPHPNLSSREFNEICPVPFGDYLVYCTDRTSSGEKKYVDKANKLPFFNIWKVEKKEDDSWGNPELLSLDIQTMQDDGPVAFSPDGKLMVFARLFEPVNFGSKKRGNRYIGLFLADIDGENFSNIRQFDFNVTDANTNHPSISNTGDVLYFSSNRAGGFGGYDLYFSVKNGDTWSEPKNLGPVINSASDEIYPFIHPSGRLYFSSNGHDQVGGFDIFYSELYNNRWFSPIKMTAPFNSPLNDFTYWIDESFTRGYLSSNRRGRSTDIFTFSSTVPNFEVCKKQQKDNYCYIFFEENTVALDSNLYQYQWDLGDNTKVRGLEAEHCYAGPGDYLVQLNVIDKLTGLVEFNQAEYLVEVRKIIQPFITAPEVVKVNEEVQLHGSESYLGGLTPGEYYWDFGDGDKTVGAAVRHIYRTPGTFQLKLGIIEEVEGNQTAQRFCSYRTIVVEE